MLITADWVLPVSRRPIRNGGVLVIDGLIAEVGTADSLAGRNADGVHRDLPGCVLVPGLVNAHTHLSLSALGGLLKPAPFAEWLPRLVVALKGWDPTDHAASAAFGARACLEAGVTVVGDIAYGPESPSSAAREGVGGVFYWEVLGIEAGELAAELERIGFPLATPRSCGSRIRCGLSPHAAYTSGPGLLTAVHKLAATHAVPVAIHVAESPAESELMLHGTGPLATLASRSAHGFTVPQCSPAGYLDGLGVLDGATAVHLGESGASDIVRYASTLRGAVACPRSNEFLHNAIAPVSRLLAAGVPVGLGTDSAASNIDLDLMEEVRALQDADPTLPVRSLIEMVTAMGAIALGVEDRFGVIEPGLQADLVAFRVGETNDPEGDFVRLAGRATLDSVLTAGIWRIVGGRTTSTEDVATPARAARVRAEHALSHP